MNSKIQFSSDMLRPHWQRSTVFTRQPSHFRLLERVEPALDEFVYGMPQKLSDWNGPHFVKVPCSEVEGCTLSGSCKELFAMVSVSQIRCKLLSAVAVR